MDEDTLGVQSGRQMKVAFFWAAILGVPGLLALLFSGREIILAVGRLLGN
jgi:hypothetical protein